MTQKEVKSSYSLKYLGLTLLTAIILSGVSLLFSRFQQTRPIRELTVFQGDQVNLLSDEAFPRDLIEASYFLKGSPKKKISTLFRTAVAITNSGNEGAENLLVAVSLQGEGIALVSKPKIRIEPEGIGDAMSITKDPASTDTRHLWNIPLLNPKESVVFEYVMYSADRVSDVKLNVVPRKKDWRVIRRSPLSQVNSNSSALLIIFLAGGAPIFAILLILGIALPIYKFQWLKRRDFREQYGSFFRFYWKHRPWDLFK